jgi:predicted Zn-dependent protease
VAFSAAAAAPAFGTLSGCAVSPVTGEQVLVGMTPQQEIAVTARVAPQQFSTDLGAVQDQALNAYASGVAANMHPRTHRPDMPYSYRVLNANYLNAYTFPGGAMGITRGLMVELDNEAELAALWGHELGHVNARHAAQRAGQAMVAEIAVAGLSIAVSDKNWGVAAGIGAQIGASALLASYSRDNEREADALGQEYMVRAGYPAEGMVGLHQVLLRSQKETPSALETMFSSHPMSSERVANAQQLAQAKYGGSRGAPVQRERFMDSTAQLRRIKPAIQACKEGETAMSRKRYPDAQGRFETALRTAPRDYAANLRMSQCLQAQGRRPDALRYADTARNLYPQEAQAHKQAGVLRLQGKQHQEALAAFEQFDQALPGDAGIVFLKGASYEGMGDRARAAQHYQRVVRTQQQGEAAQYAQSRLKAWGYAK